MAQEAVIVKGECSQRDSKIQGQTRQKKVGDGTGGTSLVLLVWTLNNVQIPLVWSGMLKYAACGIWLQYGLYNKRKGRAGSQCFPSLRP